MGAGSLNRRQKGRLREYYADLDLKPCWTCGTVKELGEFGSDKNAPDGLRWACMECVRRVARAPRADWRERNREYRREYNDEYERQFPEKRLARNTLNQAIIDGSVTRPDECSNCGRGGAIDGHHGDYDRPLDVDWLCKSCHKRVHCGTLVLDAILNTPQSDHNAPKRAQCATDDPLLEHATDGALGEKEEE